MPKKRLPIINLAGKELADIKLPGMEVLDGTVIRVPRAYPTYFGTYSRFDEIRRSLRDFKISS